MSQQSEQNKTAENLKDVFARKRSYRDYADALRDFYQRDAVHEAIEFTSAWKDEYASQQTASLQKQVDALEIQKKVILQREAETNRLYKKQVEELRKEKERLKEWKREMMQLNKSIFDWGHSKETELQIGSSIFAEAAKRLYAYRHLESENAAANKRIEELFKEKQELERKYNLLRYGSKD